MNPFEKINYDSLAFLIKQLEEYSDEKIIKTKYQSDFPNYSDNLDFLKSLNLITIDQGIIKVTEKLDETSIKTKIVKKLVQSKNTYTEYFKNYMENYEESINGDYTFQEKDTIFSDIRNFLVQIGLIEFISNKEYLLNNVYAPYIFTKHRYYSQDALDKNNIKNKAIGDAAEIEIIEYEKNRLKNLTNKEFFVSLVSDNTSLGYDIESGIDKFSPENKRFIEVKAVSLKDFGFYWSSGEIETSNEKRDSYYLYLLPCINNDEPYKFDINMLKIIKNPYLKVYKSDSWKREVIKYRFSLIKDNS